MAGQVKKGSSKAPAAMKDKSDLNLSPSHFVAPIGNDETQEIFAFKNQADNDSMSEFSEEDFASPDDSVDHSRQTETFSVARVVRGRPPKRQKTEDLPPMGFVRLNTSVVLTSNTECYND